jgi:hypothetical protein
MTDFKQIEVITVIKVLLGLWASLMHSVDRSRFSLDLEMLEPGTMSRARIARRTSIPLDSAFLRVLFSSRFLRISRFYQLALSSMNCRGA